MGLAGNLKVDAFRDLTEITVLSLKNNNIRGHMMDCSSNQKLTRIDISRNMLLGPMSISLFSLGILESLSVQHNWLGGHIPDLNQSTLKELNLSYNNLSGLIPTTQALQKFDYSSYIGNSDLCGSPSHVPCEAVSPSQLNSGNKNGSSGSNNKDPGPSRYAVIFCGLLLVCLAIASFLSVLYYMKYRKLRKLIKQVKATSTKQTNEESKTGGEKDQDEGVRERDEAVSYVGGVQEKGKLIFTEVEDGAAAEFELGDILKASAEGLGRGIFGNSYKAKMIGKEAVVVKRIRDLKPLITEEFNKQLQLIANLKHPNLLPLLAYYHTKDEKLLLYRYVPNGNLFNRLFEARGPNRIPFTWTSRLSVAQGVARAVEYLHLNATSPNILPHGNLKSTNILLNENGTVLVSDYGFASLVSHPIAVQRMVSYKAPEYKRTKRVSVESDVWSYGSLLLELLTGKISVCTAPSGVSGVDLCSWVHRAVREEWTAEIFDVELSDEHRTTSSGMLRLLQIAMQCCDPSPEKRPMMSEVAREVQNIRITETAGVDSDDSVDD
ncbi:probable inactive receptor kinase At2g26730 [Argentina anserina]|uniref:probable inactive receptor kinase At2g26730 n=1 Tax=Argentina anserina TaxID=57926 RepID=UPI0021767937|nr:probable inactive receptor kinase At2g26730 [Potentilla anserina]